LRGVRRRTPRRTISIFAGAITTTR
jgi:hypothetical protein